MEAGGGTQAQYERGSFSCPCCPRLWSPDVGLNAHAAVLQARVHCEVNGVGGFPAVVLMDQHGVLCDVMARSIPGKWNTVVDSCLRATSIPNRTVAWVSLGTQHPW